MSEVSIVVFEHTPRWAPELKRRYSGKDAIVRECSLPRDVVDAVGCGTPVAVLVLDGRAGQCLEIVGQLAKRPVRPFVVAIVDDGSADLEWPLRELGVTSVVSDRITSDDLVALCDRMLKRK